MAEKIKVTFKEWDCYLAFSKYVSSNNIAIRLFEEETHELVAIATVNIDRFGLKDKEVIIKDWSENEGILKALQDANIVSESKAKIATGFVAADLCELLIEPKFN